MSSKNVAHVSSVDKGLKMKIKRTKVQNSTKHDVVKSETNSTKSTLAALHPSSISSISSTSMLSSSVSSVKSLSSSSLPSSSSLSALSTSPSVGVSSSSTSVSQNVHLSSTNQNPGVKSVNVAVSSDNYSHNGVTSSGVNSAIKSKIVFGKKGNASGGQTSGSSTISMGGRNSDSHLIDNIKQENVVHDPYEFDMDEDKIELPPKKLKIEKVSKGSWKNDLS